MRLCDSLASITVNGKSRQTANDNRTHVLVNRFALKKGENGGCETSCRTAGLDDLPIKRQLVVRLVDLVRGVEVDEVWLKARGLARAICKADCHQKRISQDKTSLCVDFTREP